MRLGCDTPILNPITSFCVVHSDNNIYTFIITSNIMITFNTIRDNYHVIN